MTMHLLVRLAREKKAVLIPLVAALLLNAALAAFVVYPLSRRVTDAVGREERALTDLRGAQQEHTATKLVLDRRTQAASDLDRFYTKVLPAGLTEARRQTYVRLARLAREAELQYQRRLEDVQAPRQDGSGPAPKLTRLEISMVLRGEYESVRQFIRDIETTEEFIAIDDVSLAEGTEPGAPLVLSLVMSTYFRTDGHGR